MPSVDHILVRATLLERVRAGEREANEYLVGEVCDFLHELTVDGHYARAELPAAACLSAAMDRYAGEVSNGGHWQFAGNTGWAPDVVAACRAGLRALPNQVFAEPFERFVAFVEANPAALERMCAQTGYDTQDAVVHEIDEAFYAAGGAAALTAANAAWLCGLPELRPVPDAALPGEMQRLRAANPDAELRRAARLAAIVAAHRENGHFLVAQALAGLGTRDVELRSWRSPRLWQVPDGSASYLFTLETGTGAGLASIGREQSRLYLGTPDEMKRLEAHRMPAPSLLDRLLRRRHPAVPVVEVPTAVLARAVLDRTGSPLEAHLNYVLLATSRRSSQSAR